MKNNKGGDNDTSKDPKKASAESEPIPGKDEYNMGEEIGTRIGEGHDPVEDEVK